MKNKYIINILTIVIFLFPTLNNTSVQADPSQPGEEELLNTNHTSTSPLPQEIGLTAEEKEWLKEHPDIVLGTDETWAPGVIPNRDGTIKGIEVDFIDRINRLTGANIRLVLGRWDDMLEKARNRKIDGLAMGTYQEERSRYLQFSDTVYSVYEYIFIKKGAHKNLKAISDLKGLKIGYQNKNLFEKKLLGTIEGVIPIAVPDKRLLIDMLCNNSVDGVLATMNFRLTAIERLITDIDVAFIVPGSQMDIVYSTRNDWPELNSIINKALKKIPFTEKVAILKEWGGYAEHIPTFFLDKKETAWLKNHPIVRVASDAAWAPLEFLDKNGKYQGIAIDYLKQIEEKLNIRFEWEKNVPRHQMVDMARDRSIDMFSCAVETPQQSEYLSFTSPYMSSPIVIFSQPEMPYVGDLSGLEKKKAVVVNGHAIQEILKKAHPKIIIVPARDIQDAFQKIESGKASYYIGSLIVTSHYIMQSSHTLLKVAGETPYTYSLSMASRNDWPIFGGILKKALNSISSEKRNEIYRKWISVTYEHRIDYSLIWKFAGVVLFFVGVIIFWNRRLKYEVNRQTAKIKTNETFLNNLLEAIPIPVFYKDRNGSYTGFNKAFEEFFGATKEQMIGKTVFEIYPPEFAKVYFEKDQELFNHGGEQRYQFQIKNALGDIRDVIFNKAVLRDNAGEITGLVGSVLDITDQKAAQDSLRLTQFSIDESSVPMLWLTHSGTYIYANKATLDLTGYNLEDFLTSKFILHPNKTSHYQDKYLPIIKEKKFISVELDLMKKNGDLFPALVNGTYLNYEGKEYILLSIIDLSERKTLENQLLQVQKMEAIGTLAGGIAHDFNNILSVILGYADMTMKGISDDSDLFSNLKAIKIAGERAKNLVSQILTFSRQKEQNMQPLKVQLIVKETLKLLRSSIPSTIEIRQHIDQECKPVMADPTQIHQVMMNLCTNAYHAMRETGGILGVTLKSVLVTDKDSIRRRTLKPGTYLELEISDTGCGINIQTDHLNKIFEPYFTTKPKGQGTGLGLAIVHGIVKNLSGEIEVYSEIHKGTTFRIYLPVIKETETEIIKEDFIKLPTGTERILMVDDDEPVLTIHKKMLEDLGYKLTVLTDSLIALNTFQEKPDDFDLVITDMTMPQITGENLAKMILTIRPQLPIILCTGYSEIMDTEKAEAIGIRSYILKPVIQKHLAETVRAVLDKAGGNIHKKSFTQECPSQNEGDHINADHPDHRR